MEQDKTSEIPDQNAEKIKRIFTGNELVYNGRTRILKSLLGVMEVVTQDISYNERLATEVAFESVFSENRAKKGYLPLYLDQDQTLFIKNLQDLQKIFLDECFDTRSRMALLALLISSMREKGELKGNYEDELNDCIHDLAH